MQKGEKYMKTLAIIMTVHNRKERTLECLESLSKVKHIPEHDIIICDDASTDGTEEAIRDEFSDIIIVKGDGNCFWTRGMNLAMKEAKKRKYEYYLMVNDDVQFLPEMWDIMYSTLSNRRNIGVTGAMCSKLYGTLTYSGSRFFQDDGDTYVSSKIPPSGEINNFCDVANWNCFLITNEVIERIGLIDPVYEHSFGDYDYSLQMIKNGMKICISSDYVGYCENNSINGTYRDGKLNWKTRIKKIFAPTGLPVRSWITFVNRHYKKKKLKNIAAPYIKFFLTVLQGKNC